jgi:Na+-transporting NADH:ubiquinone oxidoreductase subunit NqrC
MSGATLTGKGVNNMLKDYLACYENYLKKKADVNQ